MSLTSYLPFESDELAASGIAGDALAGSTLPGGLGSLGVKTAGAGLSAVPGIGPLLQSILGAGTGTSILGPNAVARFVTGFLGVLLIAAAIFTHPTVINIGKKAARAANKAAEVGAAAA